MNDSIYTITKSDFPVTLQNMPQRPKKLFIRGQFSSNPSQKYLCVIGSRICSQYGKKVVNELFEGLRGYPISIVSGLAIGIDSYAHQTALDVGLHCVGFPGSTLDWNAMQPKSRTGLAQRIVAQGGALLSGWPVGYDMGKWVFPARNKFMAGISHATLIIEAAQGSGSLMTADHALEYSRNVLAVPGSLESPLSYGPHMLIKRGARLVTSAKDILEELGFETSQMKATSRQHILESLDPGARKLYDLIAIGGMTADSLVEHSGFPIHTVNVYLSMLEFENLIKNTGGGLKLC